jgi:hypothetical protein
VIPYDPDAPAHDDNDFHEKRSFDLNLEAFESVQDV